MVKQHRFTVYTQDASEIRDDPVIRREFTWKLNMGQIVEPNAKVKMAIESIHCRDMSHVMLNGLNGAAEAILPPDVDAVKSTNQPAFFNTQIQTAIGNVDEKELYSIRCRNVNSRYFWDSRPNEYEGGPLIYNGSLNFRNTNPEKSFCFDVDGDIANSEFTLVMDDNHLLMAGVNQRGVTEFLEVAITFILFIDSDDDKK